MTKRNLINSLLQHTRKPEGLVGRLILRGMNRGHAPLSKWALSYVPWQPQWKILDIGCGGGANIAQMLKYCPQGEVYGIDISEESVAFAQKKNKEWVGKRCFIESGNVENLPFKDSVFDVVTAFETVYFWENMPHAFCEVARVLKTDGLFLICCEASDPSNTLWTSRIEGMRVHSEEELKRVLNVAGLAVLSIHKQKKEELCLISKKEDPISNALQNPSQNSEPRMHEKLPQAMRSKIKEDEA